MRRAMIVGSVLVLVVIVAAGRGRSVPAADAEPDRQELLARIAALEAVIPDQAHIMSDVGDHFTNLWFAATAENWPLADFYLGETRSHLRWAVRAKPIRKDSKGEDVDLVHILEAFENSQLTELKQSLDGKDRPTFERVYKDSLTVCYSCHKASEKPYLRPQIPTQPETRIIDFDPKADWPR
jgi:hypothetical protein